MEQRIPPIDLLEATHTFPGPFLFKAIGAHNKGFVARIVAAIREEMRYESDPPYELRETSSGRHVAVSVELWVDSAERIRSIYERILKVEGLVLAL